MCSPQRSSRPRKGKTKGHNTHLAPTLRAFEGLAHHRDKTQQLVADVVYPLHGLGRDRHRIADREFTGLVIHLPGQFQGHST